MIDFLDELGNFKQKNFYTSICNLFLHFTTTDPFSIFSRNEHSQCYHGNILKMGQEG